MSSLTSRNTFRNYSGCGRVCRDGYLCRVCMRLAHKYIDEHCGADASRIIGSYLVCNYSQIVELQGEDSRVFALSVYEQIFINNVVTSFIWNARFEGDIDPRFDCFSTWTLSRTFDLYHQFGRMPRLRGGWGPVPKAIGVQPLSAETQSLIVSSPTACNSYRCKNLMMIYLKAVLLNKILLSETVEAGFNHSVVVDDCLVVLRMVWKLTDIIHWIGSIIFNASVNLIETVGDDRLVTYATVVAALFYIWFSMRCVRWFYNWLKPDYVLSKATITGENRFVAKRVTSDGILYEFIYDGKLIVIPHSLTEAANRQEEMALPGSNFFPSGKKSVGAILVATELTELTTVGCFFRYNDYLITAEHVVSQVSSGVASVYLATHHEGNRGVRKLDLKNVFELDRGVLELENNAINSDYDLFAVKLSKKQWSKIGVNEVSVKLESRYNQVVSAVGFINGILMTSSGRTLKDSGYVELFHTASTNPGFSGSPLYSGSSVVGMHIAADCNKNVAIRMEFIRHFIGRKVESNSSLEEDYVEYDRRDGRDYKRYRENDFEVLHEESSGRVRYRDWLDQEDKDDAEDALSSRVRFLQDLRGNRRKNTQTYSYQDESAPIKGVIKLPSEKPVHCNVSPKFQTIPDNYLNEHAEELEKLGYDKTKYVWPDIDPKTELISCRKHIELFNERTVGRDEMTDDEQRRIIRLVTEKMSANKYEAPVGYKTNSNIKRILNSSLVDIKKSPGHPYQEQSLMTNGCVLNKYGDSFVDVVLDNWDNDFQLKVFLKAEPTKGAKIEKGMPRIITGMPLHKMVKNQAVFENFRISMVENWQQSCIKYAFSPLVPGHIRHLASCFTGKVYSSDKSNWDFNCFKEFFSIAAEVIVALSYQPIDMSDEEYIEYCKDVRSCCAEVCNQAKYRCTNGEVLQSAIDGIMKSGWLLTIDVNSICQVAFDYWIKIRMGYADDEILEMEISAGGDDVIQEFPGGFDTEKYREIAKRAGFELSEFEVTDSFNGCEFFSNVFTKRDGTWTFKPQRFTKHVEKLRACKLEDLPTALSSHMMNHAWDNGKFRFFYDMYRNLRKAHPAIFTLQFLRKQRELQNKLSGCESC